MAIIHPNCANEECFGAFVATRTLGLYQTKSLVFDNNSDPTWTHKGQILPISQFAFDRSSPTNAQVCLSGGTGWIRKKSIGGDDWVEILTHNDVYEAVGAAGFAADPNFTTEIGWIDYFAPNKVYATALHGSTTDQWGDGQRGSGQFFLKSIDNGSSWYVPPTGRLYYSYLYNYHPGLLSIQYSATASIPSGAVIFATVRSQFGNTGGIVYSTDFGESWNPWNADKNACVPNMVGFSNGTIRPMPSRSFIDKVYIGLHVGGGRFDAFEIPGWAQGSSTTIQSGYSEHFGWLKGNGVCHNNGQALYVSTGNSISWTNNVDGPVSQVWLSTAMPRRQVAIEEFPLLPQHILVGFDGTVQDPSDGQKHICYSTDNMIDWYFKAGDNPNRGYGAHGELQTGSIHEDCGGTAIEGIALWKATDATVPSPPPTVGSGWPIWINAAAKELRHDPSWDRLYVVAETVWPAGEGLWNQPLLFQFILSGDYTGTYYENKGFLAFLPTIVLGQDTIYSGGIQYDGHLEMHVDSPTFHQATVVGRFDTGRQVYHNEDLTSSTFGYTSGWPTDGWELAGAFGASRVTSVAHSSSLIRDMTITYTQVDKPSQISGYPWTWANVVEDVPFVVNTQLREGNDLYVGAEDIDTAQPIRYINIIYSGLGWQNRGNDLPEVPINDITRGDY